MVRVLCADDIVNKTGGGICGSGYNGIAPDMSAFAREKVVPEVVDAVPPELLQVTYGSTNVSPGDTLTPTQVKDKPTISFVPEKGAYYTLIEVDHDVPSRTDHSNADVLHWKILNIQGNDTTTGSEVVTYMGSGPGKGSGFHRYTLLLFKQLRGQIDASQYTVIPNTTTNGRVDYNTRALIDKYGLQIVAGNFFQAAWDDYVPKLYVQLGFTPSSGSN